MVRAAHVAKVRKLEEEQLVQAARGVFALSKTLSKGAAAAVGGDGKMALVGDGKSNEGDDGKGKGGKGTKRKKADITTTTTTSDDEEGEDVGREGEEADADNNTPTRKKGGRGKKPPTLVMRTMAGRNLDVRELMRGIL